MLHWLYWLYWLYWFFLETAPKPTVAQGGRHLP